MSTSDDRALFEENKRAQAVNLSRDEKIFAAATNLLVAADKYDYAYLWSWLGVPIIQLPEDVMATQEVIWTTKPDIIIETGVARGGSVLFMASILHLIGKGKVIGVEVDIRPHNRETIEQHPMAKRLHLIEGSSTDRKVIAEVHKQIPSGASVMVVLDSDHSRDHVLAELRGYGPMVTKGCYLVVADTRLGRLNPSQTLRNRSKLWLKSDEPLSALEIYLRETDRFEVDPVIDGKQVLGSSPGGYLLCRRDGFAVTL